MKKIIGIFIVMLLIGTGVPAISMMNFNESNFRILPIISGNHFKFMSFDGKMRSYRIYVPPSYNGDEPVPLLLVFHGGPGGALPMIPTTGLNKKADEAGFIVVYPNGVFDKEFCLFWVKTRGLITTLLLGFRYWNFWENNLVDVDDVGYIRALIEELQETLNIDPSRIFVTGHSSGGMMTYRIGAELSDIVAAIAPLAGTIGGRKRFAHIDVDFNDLQFYIIPEPEYPLPVVIFHGLQDQNLPYEGWIYDGLVMYLSVNESVAFWVEHNECDPVPDVKISDSGNIITRTYKNGKNGSEVKLYTIVDGGHDWFGGSEIFFPPCEISANDIMWEFFESHPKQ